MTGSKRAALLAAALGGMFGAGAALAEEWRVADVAAAGIMFIDVEAVQRQGQQVTFATWTVKTDKESNGIDNWKVISVADCTKRTYRDLQIDYFAGNSFVERSVSEPFRDAAPDTMAFSKVSVACGHKPAGEEVVIDPYSMMQDHLSRMNEAEAAEDSEPGPI